jgi:hypothetical protein
MLMILNQESQLLAKSFRVRYFLSHPNHQERLRKNKLMEEIMKDSINRYFPQLYNYQSNTRNILRVFHGPDIKQS